MVIPGQIGCIWEKVVAFGQRRLYFVKMVVLR